MLTYRAKVSFSSRSTPSHGPNVIAVVKGLGSGLQISRVSNNEMVLLAGLLVELIDELRLLRDENEDDGECAR